MSNKTIQNRINSAITDTLENIVTPISEKLNNDKVYLKKVQSFQINNLYYDEQNYDITHKILNNLRNWALDKDITYAYIKHDNDVYDKDTFDSKTMRLLGKKGELKKGHYHCYVYLPYYMCLGDIAHILDCDYLRLEGFKPTDFGHKVQYLTHINHSEKYQYDIEDVRTNKREYVYSCYNEAIYNQEHKKTDVDIMFDIVDSFLLCDGHIYFNSLVLRLRNQIDDFNIVRKHWQIIRDLVNEHNAEHSTRIIEEEKAERKAVAHLKEWENENRMLTKLGNTFDRVTIEEDDNHIVELVRVNRKKKV